MTRSNPSDPHIAFATERKWHRLNEEDQLVAGYCGDRGLRASAACWDDPEIDWQAFDAIVIRSCWDYHLRPTEFHAWLDRLEAQRCAVWNTIPLLRWNSRKVYLEELRAAGVETVPTVFLEAGSTAQLDELVDRLGAEELVIKPTIGASAYGLFTASVGDPESQARLEEMLRDHELMVQPLISEVRDAGEWSLIFFGGDFSHAVNKVPKAGDIRVQEELGGKVTAAVPPPVLVAAARKTLRRVQGETLYARVDLVEVGGRGVLMELELIEPWLYFLDDPGSPERFLQALLNKLDL